MRFFAAALAAALCTLPLSAQTDDAPPPAKTDAVSTQPEESPPVRALDRSFFSAGGSILFFIDDESAFSDPAPILPAFYFGFSYPLLARGTTTLFFSASIELYSTHYRWGGEERPRPLPAAIENRDALVIGIPLGAALEGRAALSKRYTLFAAAGLLADCRMVFLAEDLRTDLGEDVEAAASRDKIAEALWSGLRWIFFELKTGAAAALNDTLSVSLGARAFIPLDSKPLPGDSALYLWRFGVLFCVHYHL